MLILRMSIIILLIPFQLIHHLLVTTSFHALVFMRPSFTRLFCVSIDWDATEAMPKALFIVMEYLPVSLQDVISYRRTTSSSALQPMKTNEILMVLRDIGNALVHLNNQLVAHR
jgi:serine/threonine protein kinase